MLSQVGRLLHATLDSWWEDRAMSMGAAIAFYSLFSLAPVLLIAIGVAGLVFGRDAAQGALIDEIGGLVGRQGAGAVERLVMDATNIGSGVLGTLVGIVTFLFLATGAFVELQSDLNVIWKAPPQQRSGVIDFIRSRFLSLGLIVGIGFLLLVSLVLNAGLSATSDALAGAFPGIATLMVGVNLAFSLAVAVVLFALMFKVLPDVELSWRDVWVGAFATGVLFTIGKVLIGYYLGQSRIASGYGAAAALITVLLWIYYSSQILLLGAEFTKAYIDRYGSRAQAISS
jgi:membrane protein